MRVEESSSRAQLPTGHRTDGLTDGHLMSGLPPTNRRVKTEFECRARDGRGASRDGMCSCVCVSVKLVDFKGNHFRVITHKVVLTTLTPSVFLCN